MLTRKEAGGLLWPGNRIACVSSCGFISEVIKGQLEKTLHQETEKSPKRVHFQGSTVCGWGELKGVESCLLKRRCPSNSEAGPNIHMFLVLPQPQAKSKRITGQKVFFLLRRGSLLSLSQIVLFSYVTTVAHTGCPVSHLDWYKIIKTWL